MAHAFAIIRTNMRRKNVPAKLKCLRGFYRGAKSLQPGNASEGAIIVKEAIAEFVEQGIEVGGVRHLVSGEFFQALGAIKRDPRAIEQPRVLITGREISDAGKFNTSTTLSNHLEKLAYIFGLAGATAEGGAGGGGLSINGKPKTTM